MNGTIDYERIGQRLKQQRESKGYTQAQLAEIVGCTDGYVSQIERAAVKPSLEFLVKVSVLYNTTIDYLILESNYALPEIIIDARIKEQLEKATPNTIKAISDMIEILITQQEFYRKELE